LYTCCDLSYIVVCLSSRYTPVVSCMYWPSIGEPIAHSIGCPFITRTLHSHYSTRFTSGTIVYASSSAFLASNCLERGSVSRGPSSLGSCQEPPIQQCPDCRRSRAARIDICYIMPQFPHEGDSTIIISRHIESILVRLRQLDIGPTIKLIMPSRTIVSNTRR
jgi:hypothetical protein